MDESFGHLAGKYLLALMNAIITRILYKPVQMFFSNGCDLTTSGRLLEQMFVVVSFQILTNELIWVNTVSLLRATVCFLIILLD